MIMRGYGITHSSVVKAKSVSPPMDIEEHNRQKHDCGHRFSLSLAWEQLPVGVKRVMIMRAQGLTSSEIAEKLGISDKTVKARQATASARIGVVTSRGQNSLLQVLLDLKVLIPNPALKEAA